MYNNPWAEMNAFLDATHPSSPDFCGSDEDDDGCSIWDWADAQYDFDRDER